jgi:peptidoglycan/xylan/chitin deacetylase (PgdA/CDA1 family)
MDGVGRDGARRWSPTPMTRASMLAHGVGAAALVLQPGLWPWVLGGVLLNHVAPGLRNAPAERADRANLTRLPDAADAVALTFDDGPTPR